MIMYTDTDRGTGTDKDTGTGTGTDMDIDMDMYIGMNIDIFRFASLRFALFNNPLCCFSLCSTTGETNPFVFSVRQKMLLPFQLVTF
jgi:hypothetical protein